MADFSAACARGRARRGRSRTQGDAFGGAKGEPEDADPAPISSVIRVRGVVESAIYSGGALARGRRLARGGRLLRSRLPLGAARLRRASRREPLLDRVEPPAQCAHLLVEVVELVVRDG